MQGYFLMAWDYFVTTIDPEGYCQPDPPTPDWPHISELGRQGWELVGLFDTEREEATAVFKRRLSLCNRAVRRLRKSNPKVG